MATLPELVDAIRDQLTNQLAPVTDVTLHIESGEFLSAETPAINIFPTGPIGLEDRLASFAEKYGGIPLAIRCRVSPADIAGGQDLLMRLMDDEDELSIVAALDADTTLNGNAQSLSWGDGWPWSGFTPYPDINGDGVYLGSELRIVVVKAHS